MKKLTLFSPLFIAFLMTGMLLSSCKMKTEREKAMDKTQEAATEIAQEDNLIVLFDGNSTEGWRGYNQDSFPAHGWIIEDGTLKCIGSGEGEAGGSGGDIIFDQKFKDFELHLKWKISQGGNSGIFYLIQEDSGTPIWHSAPEMQILDNTRHPDAKLGKDGNRMAGSLYDLIPAVPQNTKPAGEWNEVEITVYQGTVFHKQNGEVVLEYHLGTDAWKNLITNSKFKDFPQFGQYKAGYIGLQDHGNDVWFKDIKVKDLTLE